MDKQSWKTWKRWKTCGCKRAFLKYGEAMDYARHSYPDDLNLLVYACPYANHYHVGHPGR